VKLPFVVKVNQGGETRVQTWSEIKHNVPVADGDFAPSKPSAPPPPKPQGK
jgi:hypothetical protein